MSGNVKIVLIAAVVALAVAYLNNQDQLPDFFKKKVEENAGNKPAG